MYLLFSKPSELSSARIYKTENILSLRGSNNMVWHELCCGECGSCMHPRQDTSPAEASWSWRNRRHEKDRQNAFFFFKLIKKSISQSADRKSCSLFQKVWVKCFHLFYFVFQSQVTYYEDLVKKETSGALSGLNPILSQKIHWRRSCTGA